MLLLVFGPAGVSAAARFLTQQELAEDPGDVLAGLLVRHTQDIGVGTVHFAAAYLLFHGLIKIWLVSSLIRERRWAFLVARVFMGLFVVLQIFRLHCHPSGELVFLTVADEGSWCWSGSNTGRRTLPRRTPEFSERSPHTHAQGPPLQGRPHVRRPASAQAR